MQPQIVRSKNLQMSRKTRWCWWWPVPSLPWASHKSCSRWRQSLCHCHRVRNSRMGPNWHKRLPRWSSNSWRWQCLGVPPRPRSEPPRMQDRRARQRWRRVEREDSWSMWRMPRPVRVLIRWRGRGWSLEWAGCCPRSHLRTNPACPRLGPRWWFRKCARRGRGSLKSPWFLFWLLVRTKLVGESVDRPEKRCWGREAGGNDRCCLSHTMVWREVRLMRALEAAKWAAGLKIICRQAGR